MFGIKKKKTVDIKYDPDKEQPVIKTSICTGEKVAGFMDKTSKRFRDVMLIRSSDELEGFCEACGIKQEELKNIV